MTQSADLSGGDRTECTDQKPSQRVNCPILKKDKVWLLKVRHTVAHPQLGLVLEFTAQVVIQLSLESIWKLSWRTPDWFRTHPPIGAVRKAVTH